MVRTEPHGEVFKHDSASIDTDEGGGSCSVVNISRQIRAAYSAVFVLLLVLVVLVVLVLLVVLVVLVVLVLLVVLLLVVLLLVWRLRTLLPG